MLNTVQITKDGKDFHFAFDPETDDPAEGVTLTGVFENGSRIRPSGVPDNEIPYGEAEKKLIDIIHLTAQDLYDLRAATGFISGTDLHKAFTELVGEPSPKGKTHVIIPAGHWLARAAKHKSAAELGKKVDEYGGGDMPLSKEAWDFALGRK